MIVPHDVEEKGELHLTTVAKWCGGVTENGRCASLIFV